MGRSVKDYKFYVCQYAFPLCIDLWSDVGSSDELQTPTIPNYTIAISLLRPAYNLTMTKAGASCVTDVL